jgi:hypothetical protein
MDRIHYAKGTLISELWEDDLAQLLPLPNTPLEIVQLNTRVVNKYGEIKVDKYLYRVFTLLDTQFVSTKVS